MTDGPGGKISEVDRVVQEHLTAAGPFDPTHFQPAALREAFALVQRWRSDLLAAAALSPVTSGMPDEPRG
jgi:hypothetical protein